MLPGRYASIKLNKDEIQNALAVPSEAIVPEMGKDKIFLYKSGKAQPVEITTGIRTEAEVQVLQGLQAGDTIITSGTCNSVPDCRNTGQYQLTTVNYQPLIINCKE